VAPVGIWGSIPDLLIILLSKQKSTPRIDFCAGAVHLRGHSVPPLQAADSPGFSYETLSAWLTGLTREAQRAPSRLLPRLPENSHASDCSTERLKAGARPHSRTMKMCLKGKRPVPTACTSS
jgi:hypothetical protein